MKARYMTLVIVRHAERMDYKRGREWVQAAKRPWDTPLTSTGKTQALHCGQALRDKLMELGLPQPSLVFSSPLLRCVETAVQLRHGLELPTLPVHLAAELAEAQVSEWYKSWAMIPHSDSSWGGPAQFRDIGFEGIELRKEAYLPSGQLLPKRQDYPEEKWQLNSNFSTPFSPSFTVEQPEDHNFVGERLGSFAQAVQEQNPEKTIVLVSHGGPSAELFRHLVGYRPAKIGFTGTSILAKEVDGKFVAHLESSTAHLGVDVDLGFASAFVENVEKKIPQTQSIATRDAK